MISIFKDNHRMDDKIKELGGLIWLNEFHRHLKVTKDKVYEFVKDYAKDSMVFSDISIGLHHRTDFITSSRMNVYVRLQIIDDNNVDKHTINALTLMRKSVYDDGRLTDFIDVDVWFQSDE